MSQPCGRRRARNAGGEWTCLWPIPPASGAVLQRSGAFGGSETDMGTRGSKNWHLRSATLQRTAGSLKV
jgi:hypothetical protein